MAKKDKVPSDYYFFQGIRRFKAMSARKRKNHQQVCYCLGWWFPHRQGSSASELLSESLGTQGCIHQREKCVPKLP